MNGMMISEEELLLRNTVREFADQELAVRAADYDESGKFPWDNLDTMKELGIFGLTIDEEYGGSGGTWRQLALVVEELARGCASTSLIYIAHLSLTMQFIHQFGNEEQKRKFLPPMAVFDKIGSFALTEPEAGSDAGALQTMTAQSNGHYVLNGRKTFITNAPQAEIFVILATRDRSLGIKGIDALIVERDDAGMTVNPLTGKMGMRATSARAVAGCVLSRTPPVRQRVSRGTVGGQDPGRAAAAVSWACAQSGGSAHLGADRRGRASLRPP